MRGIAACVGAILLAGAAGENALTASERRPNVLLIVSDDQGYPDLGCLGLKPIQTPHLDRLAAEGVRGSSFYVTWPACTPSRASLLTGRYPQRNGLYDMIRNDMVNYGHRYTPQEYAVSPEMTLGLDTRELTLGNFLQSAGYRTGMVGKWDMGQARRFLPLQRGFDFFYGHGNNGIDYYTHERYGIPSLFRGNTRTQEDKGIYATDLFKREALRFLDEKSDKPWFLYLAFNAPHGASSFEVRGVQAPPEYVQRYKNAGLNERLQRYYAAVTCMDEAIGAILDRIHKRGEADNTIVIFFSDNGGAGNGGNEPLKGAKGTLWEGGIRVPFIFKWTGHVPAGKTTDAFLTTLEIAPTLARACGVKLPENLILDGYDMIPALNGQPSPRTEMYWEHRTHRACRVKNWKWLDSDQGKGLFDLSRDLGETKDLSAQHPEVVAELQKKYAAWRKAMEEAEPRGPFRDY